MKSECAACHHVFGGLKLFDKHQDVDYHRRPSVVCIEPETLGLVRGDDGTWRTPLAVLGVKQRVARMHQAKRRESP